MIDALISGRLYGTPEQRTSKAGKLFVVAKVRAAAGNGDMLFVNVVAFDTAPCTTLLSLNDGDSVSLSGSLTPRAWTDKTGAIRSVIDLVAHQALTAYNVSKKRRALAPAEPGRSADSHTGDQLDF
jgi:single-stranded DNA-binding protein